MKLLIIQSWFSAIDHLAQSLLNLSSAFGKNTRVEYLVAIHGMWKRKMKCDSSHDNFIESYAA